MKKRIIISIISLFILFLVPCIHATTVTTIEQFKEAVKDSSVAEITLGADIKITNGDLIRDYIFEIDEIDRTLDLNGHLLVINKGVGSEYGLYVVVKQPGKKLTITNSKNTGKIENNNSNAVCYIENSDIDKFDLDVHDIRIDGVSGSILNGAYRENIYLDVNNVEVIKTSGTSSLFFYFSEMHAKIRNFTMTKTDSRNSMYITTVHDTRTVADVVGESKIYYDNDLQDIAGNEYFYKVYPNNDYLSVKIKDSASTDVTKHTVSFNTRGGSTIESVQVADGEPVEKPADPIKAGWYVSGWTDTDGSYSGYAFSRPVTKDMTLYTLWCTNISLYACEGGTFNLQGLGYDLKGKTGSGFGVYEEEYTVTAVPNEGYSFVEWRSGSPTGEVISRTASYTFTGAPGINLYAIFKLKEPNTIYDISLSSKTDSVKSGVLPEFQVGTSTKNIKIELYGPNTCWMQNSTGNPSDWTKIDSDIPTAVVGNTHYGLRVRILVDDGYSIDKDATIRFNSKDIKTSNISIIQTFSWGAYVYIDLGTASQGFLKGDITKDNFINSTDAALVLDKFKNNDATEEDFELGNMNEDNVLNGVDAAIILDIFKNS